MLRLGYDSVYKCMRDNSYETELPHLIFQDYCNKPTKLILSNHTNKVQQILGLPLNTKFEENMSKSSNINSFKICYKVYYQGSYHISNEQENNEPEFILFEFKNIPLKNRDKYYARMLHKIEGVSQLEGTITTKEFKLTYEV